MALLPSESASAGMYKAVKDSESVFGSTNKANNAGGSGLLETKDEYDSKLSEEEITKLTDEWKRRYLRYYNDIEPTQKQAFDYWIGKQTPKDLTVSSSTSDPNPLTDNFIFTAVETFLPLATRANPDPVVSTNPEAQEVGHAIHAALVYEADRQMLRRKNARLIRQWMWNRIGVIKIHWNYQLKQIETVVINSKRMIFDPNGYVDEGGRFRGEYLGERKKDVASRLVEMFPRKKAEIEKQARGQMGTELDYIEWWYRDTDVFFTLDVKGQDATVLGKYKNPNWNYDIVEQEAKEAVIDEQSGVEVFPAQEYRPAQEGINFFDEPQAPYLFLSIFSSNTHPHDETSLISQVIPLQDIVNRRLRQIDDNAKGMNNGLLVSGKSFTEDQAAGAASALRGGKAIIVPDGDVNNGAKRFPPEGLPDAVFKNYEDSRAEGMNIFGTAGSTSEGTSKEDTVRGKIMVQQQDTSRIGGTVTEQLEQVDDSIYQYWVQMMFVFYDDEHLIATAGTQGGIEIIPIRNSMFPLIKTLDITVKEGSLIPKDPLTQRNEAMDLWTANAIDPLEFYRRLDVPDPAKATERLMLWQLYQKGAIPPQAYLPNFEMPQQAVPVGQVQTPGVNPNVEAQNLAPQPAAPSSPPAVEQQMSNLIKSVPEQKI